MTESAERPPSLTEAQLDELDKALRAAADGGPIVNTLGELVRLERMWFTAEQARAYVLLQNAAPSLLSSLREARALLGDLEWSVAGPVTWNCPACGGAKDNMGHRAGCRIRAFLGERSDREQSFGEPK